MKKGPLIFITLLSITLVFILGVQYGKKVEDANKTIRYVLSITPQPTKSETSKNVIKFTKYTHSVCGVAFMSPEGYAESKISSYSSSLKINSQIIMIDCTPSITPLIDTKTATSELKIAGKTVQGHTGKELTIFAVKNSQNRATTVFTVDNNLLPLIINTIELIN